MNDLARQKLKYLVSHYGISVADDPKRLRGLLADVCPAQKREVHVLVAAAEQRVHQDLQSSSDAVPWEVLSARLVRRLHDDLGLAGEAASWAVESWALSLGRIDQPAQSTLLQPTIASSSLEPEGFTPPVRSLTQNATANTATLNSSRSFAGLLTGLTIFVLFIVATGSLVWYVTTTQEEKNRQDAERATITQLERRAILGEYDQNSLRWKDDQLVIDFVLRNASSFELRDCSIQLSLFGLDSKDSVVNKKLWRSLETHSIPITIPNCGLDASHLSTPPYTITGYALHQHLSGKDKKEHLIHIGKPDPDPLPATVLGSYHGTGASPAYNSRLGMSANIKGENGSLHLDNTSSGFPSMKKVRLLIVSYNKDKEVFRLWHDIHSWPIKTKHEIPVPAKKYTELKIRGVGDRTDADLFPNQQRYYICENFGGLQWKDQGKN